MMKVVKIALFAAIPFFFFGCDSSLVSTVKNTVYTDGVTIGDVFNKTKFCKSVEWSEVENKKYGKLAQAECEVDTAHYMAWGKYLVFNFQDVKGEVDFFNTYWLDKNKKIVGGLLSYTQSGIIMESDLLDNMN